MADAKKPKTEALYYGTGRRKTAVARVRLVPGTGKVTINGRDGNEYFTRAGLLASSLRSR